MNKILTRTEFGNPILNQKTCMLSKQEVQSPKIQKLIGDMFYTLEEKKYGVALAAPQVGQSIALTVINIKPTRIRPDLPKNQWAKMAVINPKITKTYGKRSQLWEGCVSFPNAFAKVPRYKKIELQYLDEKGTGHKKVFEGLLAHVLQHETDHLNGHLFVEKVRDTSSFMTESEYVKRVVGAKKNHS
jgi:peptide deformylase